MVIPALLVIVGFALIIVAADELVKGASTIAASFHIPPLIIGLTIVAFGTSAPEIVVSITAALTHKSELAMANAIGSNIANIGLVLGLTALLNPLKLHSTVLKRELPLLFVIMVAVECLLGDGFFSIYDGVLLLLGLGLLLAFIVNVAKHNKKDHLAMEMNEELSAPSSYPYGRLLFGLLFLPLSAQLIVANSVTIASYWGVSETLIGLTIVAIGTSLPEVVTSLVGALKGEDDIALGNVIGSNMFNLLAVLPFAGLFSPSAVPNQINVRDMPVMLGITLLLVVLMIGKRKTLTRLGGAILCSAYLSYMSLLLWTSQATF